MHKRFTDIHKWQDPWFRKLSPAHKLLWIYICDHCDNAGVWKVDFETAAFFIGANLDAAELHPFFEQRIEVLQNNGWLIKKFVDFQFGRLSKSSPLHRSILSLMGKHTLSLGYPKPRARVQVKDIDKEKDVVKTKVKDVTKVQHLEFVFLTQDEYSKLLARMGNRHSEDFIKQLDRYIGSTGKKYKSHYYTILNWYENALKDGKLHATNDSASRVDLKAELRAKREAEAARAKVASGKVSASVRDSEELPGFEGRRSAGGTDD